MKKVGSIDNPMDYIRYVLNGWYRFDCRTTSCRRCPYGAFNRVRNTRNLCDKLNALHRVFREV